MTLETPHLRLIPWSPAQLLALVEGSAPFDKAIGVSAAEGLGDFFRSADVSSAWVQRLRASAALDPWLHGFAVVHRGDRCVIGSAAFKGPPDEQSVVEIAYGIVPAFQGHGYATEAAAALVAFAFGSGLVRVVRAHTLPTPNASTRVLSKCGFDRVAEVVDPDDGPVWRWERGLA